MVPVAPHHARHARQRAFAEARIDERTARERSLRPVGARMDRRVVEERVDGARAEAVALQVRLVQDVEPVLVAEVVERGIVRVVARADGVDVVAFHEADILDHPFARHEVAFVGVDLVPVDALEEDRLSVHADAPAQQGDLAESHAERQPLENIPGRRTELDGQRVEVRILRAPETGRRHAQLRIRPLCPRDDIPLRIGQHQADIARPRRLDRHAARPGPAGVGLAGVRTRRHDAHVRCVRDRARL